MSCDSRSPTQFLPSLGLQPGTSGRSISAPLPLCRTLLPAVQEWWVRAPRAPGSPQWHLHSFPRTFGGATASAGLSGALPERVVTRCEL